jgi:hypothetical protein
MNPELLNLPWQVQLSLASGYAAYLVANAGNRDHHSAIDVAFTTLLFGLFATLLYNLAISLLSASAHTAVLAGIAAFCVTAMLGALWRKWGRPLFFKLMRDWGIAISNDDPSALTTILADAATRVSQISVKTEDGCWLHCDDTRLFANSPRGPVVIGPSGDVGLYLTHFHTADGELKAVEDFRNPDHGDMMTYVPASRVVRIKLRLLRQD